MASRLYFKEIFGNDFHRHADDNINAGLNMVTLFYAVHLTVRLP